jgi:hypothetical protein
LTPTSRSRPELPVAQPTPSRPRPELPVAQPTPSSPFGGAVPNLRVAVGYLVAALVWVVAGASLPGGRWFAVHLFTLGALTNLILVFSEHFARTLTRAPEVRIRWQLPVLNLGVLAVLVGLPAALPVLVAAGATVVTATVVVAYARLRRLRRDAVGARFTWVVRGYERAHGAFVHGAILGALLGTGVLGGAWYGSARLAHLHVNILGWAGLTLLSTLVFFGPTITRCRIEPGADDRAARALRHGATGLTVGVLLLLATGVGGAAAVWLRVGAALGLAVFGWAATVTCAAVFRAVLRAKPTATRASVAAVCLWLPAVVWADVAVVATGSWRLLDAVGLAALIGVLVPAVAATLTFLAPMLRGPTLPVRTRIIAQLERRATLRTVAGNAAALTLVVTAAFGSALGPGGAWMARLAWVAFALAVLPPLVFAVARPRAPLIET